MAVKDENTDSRIADGAADAYHRRTARRGWIIAAAALLCVAAALADILTGPASLTSRDVLAAVFAPSGAPALTHTVVWTFRLPTALFALLIGASLGLAGAEMQTILDNPLASPYTLGVSAAAGFGAALAIVLGAGMSANAGLTAVPVSAFAFAMFASLVLWGLGRVKKGATDPIILCGVALLFLFNAALAFLQYVASQDQLQAIVFWLFGSLQGATWPRLALLAGTLALVVPLLASQAWKLTALRLGDAHARSMGIRVERLRLQVMLLTSLLTATAVCFAGAIGFIGLVAPHLARILTGEEQRGFMPLSALLGALLLSLAALAGKLVVPGAVFPIGITTAFIGVPFFAAMVLGKRRNYW